MQNLGGKLVYPKTAVPKTVWYAVVEDPQGTMNTWLVVAEGILRNMEIPPSRLARRVWLKSKKLAILRLNDDIEVAALYGRHTAKLNLDTSFLCCDSSAHSRTRLTATAVLLHTPAAAESATPAATTSKRPRCS